MAHDDANSAGQPVELERARGSHVWDAHGQRYLDLSGSKTAVVVGHSHPAVVAAISEQAGRLLYAPASAVTRARARFLEAFLGLAPPGLDAAALAMSGSDAVGLAIKIAQIATGRQGIVVLAGSHHGRGPATVPLSEPRHPVDREAAAAVPVAVAPFPQQPASFAHGSAPPVGVDAAIGALQRICAEGFADGAQPAALVIEPIQGRGGVRVPAPGFLTRVSELCHANGIVMIVDEVQCGLGRTGQTWAFQTEHGAEPDLLVAGKGLGGGLPLAGVLGRSALMENLPPSLYGGTFLASPVSLAAGSATIGVLEEERLPDRAAALGAEARWRCEQLLGACSWVRDIRGRGLMLGIELSGRPGAGQTSSELTARVRARCQEEGVLVHACGDQRQVLRITPPLSVGRDDLDQGLQVVSDAIAAAG